VHVTLGGALVAGAAILALAAPDAAVASSADATQGTGVARAGAGGAPPDAGGATGARQATGPRAAAAIPVVLVGIGGLRWSDVSPTTTPALWRLAGHGSVGSLVVGGIHPRTCPADGWLTLNAAARAAVPHAASGPCPAVPAVTAYPSRGHPGAPSPAWVSRMPGLVSYNARFHYNPQWGLLAAAPGAAGLPGVARTSGARGPVARPGSGRCATAVGPGAALALASPAGRVGSYLPSPDQLTAATLARCPLTIIDLGSLPSAPGPAGESARAAAARAADRQLGRIMAALPARSTLVVAAPGDGPEPHLRAIVVSGPGYSGGLLAAASTRQPGLVLLTDLTPTMLGWLDTPVPSAVVGSPLHAVHRGGPGGLAAALRTLAGQDAAAQVYRHTVTPFYQLVGFGYPALFALIALIAWAGTRIRWPRKPRRRARIRAAGRAVAAWAAAVPAGTFLASLVPWWTLGHPALVLYALAAAWAAVVAAVALAGPLWRKDPLGPAGVIAAVTLGVIGLGLMTGSRLMLETPFGLDVLEAGRFYGLGNNAVVIYAASGIFCAAWLGGALLRRGESSRALPAMAAVAAFTVIVAAWPGFGAKVGGTIAMLPGFLVLILAAIDRANADKANADKANADKANADKANADKANADKANPDKANADKANADKAAGDESNGDKSDADRAAGDKAAGDKGDRDKSDRDKGNWLTWPRAALIGVSGLALVTLFALVNYFVPATGHSDIGGFTGQLLHGGAGAIVQRKIGSNLGSLTANPFNLVIPVVLVVSGVVVAWPERLWCRLLARAYRQIPVLKPALAAVWLTAVLSWFAEDSGITVPAAALPFVLPLIVVILSSLPAGDQKQATAGPPAPSGQLESASSQGQATVGGHRSAQGERRRRARSGAAR
jgi:hypothetical protein